MARTESAHDFAPGFRIELHHKDLGIALRLAREVGVPLPVTAVVDQMLQELQGKGRGKLDHSAVLTVIEDAAQHKIGDQKRPSGVVEQADETGTQPRPPAPGDDPPLGDRAPLPDSAIADEDEGDWVG